MGLLAVSGLQFCPGICFWCFVTEFSEATCRIIFFFFLSLVLFGVFRVIFLRLMLSRLVHSFGSCVAIEDIWSCS